MSTQETKESIIVPPQKLSLDLGELWRYRELFYFFTWRDIKVKYKQTVLGVFWAILQPLFMMVLFTFFFGRALKIESRGLPYPLFVFSGLAIWNLFSTGITNAGNSMVSNASIIKKIYFPRLIIPMSSILSSLIDFCIALIMLIILVIYYQQPVNVLQAMFFWPLGILLACIGTFGPGCWLAALNIKYRDFRYVIPFLVQVLLFLTPVIYPITVVENGWIQILLALNPMYSAVEVFRAPLIGLPNQNLLLISLSSSIILFFIGLLYFKKTEMYFADLA